MNNGKGSPQKKKTDKEYASELFANAESILEEVGEGVVFRSIKPREFPTFQRSELGFAKTLGVGGFCVVKEIRNIRLQKQIGQDEHKDVVSKEDDENEAHLEVSTARDFIARNCLRNGDARYSVKRLRNKELNEREEARGIVDLAIEAKFLTVLSDPNIIKMRALAEGDPIRKDYFIVLDRLYGTLEDRMNKWKAIKKKNKGFMKVGGNKDELKELLVDRLTVAYDISSAFRYMHSHKLVYRDIKPENIGFDIRGDVKVFDFGLCKSLLPQNKVGGGLYKMTGRTGSWPYMAPEVFMCAPYNSSCDVYAYGVLLHQMLSLKEPFEGYTIVDFKQKVVKGGFRPPVSSSWPAFTRKLITECWAEKIGDRPSFQRIASVVRGDLVGLAKGNEAILHRTSHMMNRSARSQHGIGGAIRRRASSYSSK